jgi:hypothetical protein
MSAEGLDPKGTTWPMGGAFPRDLLAFIFNKQT